MYGHIKHNRMKMSSLLDKIPNQNHFFPFIFLKGGKKKN